MIKLYRGDTFVQNIEPVTAQLKRSLMGPFLLEIEVADTTDIYVGDRLKVEINNETFTFEIREIKKRKITAEHISYILQNYALIDKYFNDPPTYDDYFEFADVTLADVLTLLDPLLNDIGFSVINNSNSTETKDITFQGDNLLSAIQKIADTYKVEFMQHDTYIEFLDQVGTDQGITVNAGINTEKIVKNIDRSFVVTRVYPIGSSDNLPDGYFYSNLRPTTFDLSTKAHSGNVYIDNTDGINNYGIIEKIVEFSDIKIQSRKGIVEATGEAYLHEYERTYPYIYDSALADIDETKALSATLFIVDGLKAAELRIVKASASEKRIYYSKTLKDGSELSWTPSVGAKYTLVGYITQTEIDAARDKLIAAAQDYLDEHSAPKVEYELREIYLKDLAFDIGDSLHLVDDTQDIDVTVRVVEYTRDLLTNVYNSLKLSDVIEKIPYEILKEQQEQKKEIKKIKVGLTNSAQTAREALERHNLLVRNNFYGSENLKGVTISENETTAGLIEWTSGYFQVVGSNTAFTIGAGSQQLSAGTYYIFVQIDSSDPNNTGGNNKIILSTDMLTNSGTIEYYPLGMAEFDGTRTKVATSYGFTLIDGNYIKTGTIEFDKLTNVLDITGKVFEKTNVIEIGDGIGPNKSDTGIYIYDPSNSNAGYILTSSGLKYVYGKDSAGILSILKQRSITFDGTNTEEIVTWEVPVFKENIVIVKAIESVENLATNERVIVSAELLDDDGDSITNSVKIICEKIGGIWHEVSKGRYSTSLSFDLTNVSYAYATITTTVYGRDWFGAEFFTDSITEERVHAYSGAANRTVTITVSDIQLGDTYITYNVAINWGDGTTTIYPEKHTENRWYGGFEGFWRLSARIQYVDVSTRTPAKAAINCLILMKG